MNAEILCIGTEILLGDIVNSNAQFLAKVLAENGIDCFYQSVVGDNSKRLDAALEIAIKRSDIVFTVGGLGPTYDDITKERIAHYFGKKLCLDANSFTKILEFFEKNNKEMTANNKKQAEIIEGAEVIENSQGLAPGVWLEIENKIIVMLPGPPREFKYMVTTEVGPRLAKLNQTPLFSTNIHIFGVGESYIEHQLKAYMEAKTNPTIAPYAKEEEVVLRISAKACNKFEAEKLFKPVITKIRAEFDTAIYGIDEGNLAHVVGRILVEKQVKLAIIDIVSGGKITTSLMELPESEQFLGGSMTQSSMRMLEKYFALAQNRPHAPNRQTSLHIAHTFQKQTNADIVIAIMPDETSKKESGVYKIIINITDGMACVTKHVCISSKSGDERERLQKYASAHGLYALLMYMKADEF